MTANATGNTATPGRARRIVGFIRSYLWAVRALAGKAREVEAKSRGYEQLAAAFPVKHAGVDDAAWLEALDRNGFALDQLFEIRERIDRRLTPSQILHACIDAVADASAVGAMTFNTVRSEAELKQRVYTRLLAADQAVSDEDSKPSGSSASATHTDIVRTVLEALPCVKQAGNLEGFVRECIAETTTTALAEVSELKAGLIDVSEADAVRLSLETLSDVMTRRIGGDIRAIILQVLGEKYPGVFKHDAR